MAILISLSDLFSLDANELEISVNPEKKYPIYKAILLGLLYPCEVVCVVQIVKLAVKERLNMIDASMLYFLIIGIAFSIISAIIFATHGAHFSRQHFMQGLWASIASTIAASLTNLALGLKHVPQGPKVALLNFRIVLVLIVDALWN